MKLDPETETSIGCPPDPRHCVVGDLCIKCFSFQGKDSETLALSTNIDWSTDFGITRVLVRSRAFLVYMLTSGFLF